MVTDNGTSRALILWAAFLFLIAIGGTFLAIRGQQGAPLKTKTEQNPTIEEWETQKKAESKRRENLLTQELRMDRSEIIIFPTHHGLFQAETNKGTYLVEFDEDYKEILKIIKTSENAERSDYP